MSRRTLIVFAVAMLSLVTVAGLALALLLARAGTPVLALGQRIALIEVSGIILDDERTLEDIRRFRRDRSVRGYLVAINSPGGAVGPSQSLFRELKRLREDGRPVVASIGGVGASGAYYVALAADSIFILPGSLTGSVGVIMEFPDASGLMERVGLRMEVVRSAEHKDAGSPFRPITPEDREVFQELVGDVYAQFLDAVRTERRLEPEALARIADGRVVSGRQALDLGMVDRIGNLHDAMAAVGRMSGLGDRPRMVTPPRRRFTLLDVLLGTGATARLAELAGPVRDVGPRLKYVVPY